VTAARGPRRPSDLETQIGRLLTLGTAVAVGFLTVGLALMAVWGVAPFASHRAPLASDRLAGALAGLRPEGYLWLGLLAVVATPTGRVVAALVGFARQGEREMVAVAAGVLAVVLLSIVLGAAGG
jgi:uncharacterized membrane protein